MLIIPVIDLQDGHVVHAIRGERDMYQPIHHTSRLTNSSELNTVLQDLLQFYPFAHCYIADLDAIRGRGSNKQALRTLSLEFPHVEFWIDDGSQLAEKVELTTNQRRVIGTESQRHPPETSPHDYILSLDFARHRLGHEEWFTQSAHWPDTLIAMTLSRVGSYLGPDIPLLGRLIQQFPNKDWVAAGGVRDAVDLERLATLGASAVLLASSLHGGTLSHDDIAKWQTKKYPGKPGYLQQPSLLKT